MPWLYPAGVLIVAQLPDMKYRKVYATLTCQLKVAEVKSEEAWHARYEAGLASWRTLRTQHALRLFDERLAGEWAEPQPCLGIYRELSLQQASAYEVGMLHMPVVHFTVCSLLCKVLMTLPRLALTLITVCITSINLVCILHIYCQAGSQPQGDLEPP